MSIKHVCNINSEARSVFHCDICDEHFIYDAYAEPAHCGFCDAPSDLTKEQHEALLQQMITKALAAKGGN